MDWQSILTTSAIVSVVLGVVLIMLRNKEKTAQSSPELLDYLRQTMQSVHEANRRQTELMNTVSSSLSQQNQTVVSTLQKNTHALNERLDKAAVVIQHVQKNIGEMSEIGRAMRDLQDYLKSPKLRGNIGEEVLSEALQQLLPKDLYTLQYSFKNGEKVDAVIRVGKNLIPVDAKFPVENFIKLTRETDEKQKSIFRKSFNRDVKKHIGDIAKKYIKHEENTVDYALMYIPAEAIYYEVINSQELFAYAQGNRILFVSPMSFYAYLKAILMSFQGQTIQKRAREILNILQSVQKEYQHIDESLSLLEKHFTNAYNQLGRVNKFFMRLGQTLTTTKLVESGDSSRHEEKL